MSNDKKRFVWDASRLSDRENQMIVAMLELFVMTVTLQRQVEVGRVKASPDDADQAFVLAVKWANRTFPDLKVSLSPK